MYKKLYLIPFIVTFLTIPRVLAVNPTPTPTDDSTTINDNLKKRLQETLGSTSEKDSTQTNSNKGYIGKIKDIIKDTVIMEDKDGQKDIKLVENTTIVRAPGSTTIKREDMRIDDYIIAIGVPTGSDVMDAKRIIVSIDPLGSSTKTSGMGELTKLGKTTLTIKEDGSDKIIQINSKTLYKSSVGLIDYKDLELGDTVVYTATKDEDDALIATVVMRVKTAALGQ